MSDTLSRHLATARTITAEYSGHCYACGGRYYPGQSVKWSSRLGASSIVTHSPADCVGTYSVKVVYNATSKRLQVHAPTADSAMMEAARQADPVVKAQSQLTAAKQAYLVAQTMSERDAAEAAIERAEARLQSSWHAPLRPAAYVCYQGDIIVGSSLAADVATTAVKEYKATSRHMARVEQAVESGRL